MVKSPHILLVTSNVTKLKNNLSQIIDANAMAAIDAEINQNTKNLFLLGNEHYLFAARQSRNAWRQKVSRLYYGGYNISRALRLSYSGDYSSESSDHKKIGNLPSDFPDNSRYGLQLQTLRDDRNLCDYDHTATVSDLAIGLSDATALIADFVAIARTYLTGRGVVI